ncbi:MAG: hypothetical protein ACREOM_11030 [Candidatus Dormibacteraceae bacterium]
MGMGRRVLRIVLRLVSGIVTVAIVAVAPIAIQNRLTYGTFATTGAPPRVDYCGRRYYPATSPASATLAHVEASLALDERHGLARIGVAPSGMPIVTNLNPSAAPGAHGSNVCTMELWVQTGPDSYAGYSLSGGP